MSSKASQLAHELGAIASGEDYKTDTCDRTQRFAAGLERLIEDRVAAAVALLTERMGLLESAERDGSAALAREDMAASGIHIGSCFRWVGGAYGGQIGEVTNGPFNNDPLDPEWRLVTDGAAGLFFASVLLDPRCFVHEPKARPVRAHEPDGNERLATEDELAAPVAVGDTFLRLTTNESKGFDGDEIAKVTGW